MMLGYSCLLALAVIVASPWWLMRMLTTDRYREGLKQRLGFVPAALRDGVRGKRVVWLHAVSVGEVLAATRLVAELEEALGTGWRVVISTTTRTGQALARQRFADEQGESQRVFYMPLDFAFAVRPWLRALHPEALVLMESELWPRLLHECRKRNIPVAVANARISDRSFKRSIKVRAIWSRVLRMPTLWLAQSEETAERLAKLTGIAPLGTAPRTTSTHRHPEEHRDEGSPHSSTAAPTILVTGNLKYDVRARKQSRVAELIRETAAGRPVIVAGSTVASTDSKIESEEAQVIYGWTNGALPKQALLVLAPRHPERFNEVSKLAFDFPCMKATDLLAGKQRSGAIQRDDPDRKSLHSPDIILLDTVGDLAAVYGIADIAYVGGSMFPRGGHNPLEPAQFGVPIVMGESFENFREIVKRMKDVNGIRIVKDEAELDLAFESLLTDKDSARAMGERGRQVFESQQGATARTVAAILSMMETRA